MLSPEMENGRKEEAQIFVYIFLTRLKPTKLTTFTHTYFIRQTNNSIPLNGEAIFCLLHKNDQNVIHTFTG